MAKAKPIQITITKPCSEEWSKMSPTEKGKFCNHCQKEVIDFTHWSDTALYNFFNQERKTEVCGRFFITQVNGHIKIPHQPQSKLYKIFVSFGLTLLFVHSSTKSFTQPPAKQENHFLESSQNQNNGHTTISGIVLDEENKPILGAIIEIRDHENSIITGATTDWDGKFSILLSSLPKSNTSIIAKYASYEKGLHSLGTTTSQSFTFNLKPSQDYSEIVVTKKPVIIDTLQGASIKGQIILEGKPISKASVNLYRGKRFKHSFVTDSLGAYSFNKLKPGKYRIDCHYGLQSSQDYIITVKQNELHTLDITSVPNILLVAGMVTTPINSDEIEIKNRNPVKSFFRRFGF